MKIFPVIAIIAALAVAGCADDEAVDAASGGSGGSSTSGPAPDTVEYFNQVVGDRVFFATDQHTLSPEARIVLQKQAQWLQTNGATNITVEGHADERGTRQYNLALGARRANSVRNFLIGQGVAAARVRATSLGKERPVALCSDDSCWSQNRRGVSVVAGAPSS